MQIQHIESQALHIPLRIRFSQANQNTASSEAILVKLTSQDGHVGWGEACPRTYVTGETVTSVQRDLEQISDQLCCSHFETLEDIKQFLHNLRPAQVGLSTQCALELALLDAWSCRQGRSLHDIFAVQPSDSSYSAILPLQHFDAAIERLSAFTFSSCKLKVDQDIHKSLDRIRVIRERWGSDISIRIDANCGWNQSLARQQIPHFLAVGVQSFEQILPRDMEVELGPLTAEFEKDAWLMVDESLTSMESAQCLIEQRQGNAFNLKLSKNGGLFATQRIYQLAQAHGIPCQLGAHYGESSILTSAGFLFHDLAPNLTALEGGFGDYLLEQDLCTVSLKFSRKGSITAEQWLRWQNNRPGWLPVALDDHWIKEKDSSRLAG